MVRSRIALIPLLLIFFLSGLKESFAGEPSKCLAVITEISGDVFIKKVNKNEFIKAFWGTQLFQGDQIKTSDKSDVSLLFANNSLIKLEANSMITISANESTAAVKAEKMPDNISASMMGSFSALISRRHEKEEKGALAGLRSIGLIQTIRLTSPYNTILKTNRPSFSWATDKTYESYKVNLYNSSGLLWSKKTSENRMIYPENEKDLAYDESYFWNVEGEELIDIDKSANQSFSVLSLEKAREAEEQESLIRNTFRDESESSSLHSVLGAYYLNLGLLQDAIDEFQIISKINPDAPLPHEILGSIYSDAGNKDKAIEELQKALALAKNKDK